MTKIFKSISIFVRIDEYFRNQLIDKLKNIWNFECGCGCGFRCTIPNEIALKLWYLSAGVYGPYLFIYCVIINFFPRLFSCLCSDLAFVVSANEQSSFLLVIHLEQQNDRVNMWKRGNDRMRRRERENAWVESEIKSNMRGLNNNPMLMYGIQI